MEKRDRLVVYRLWQCGVAERIFFSLAVGQTPVDERDDRLRLFDVAERLGNEKVGVRGDRVGVDARPVDDRTLPEVGRELVGDRVRRGGHAGSRPGNKVSGIVLDLGRRQLGLRRVVQLYVANRARRLLDAPRDTVVALAADADRPFDVLAG